MGDYILAAAIIILFCGGLAYISYRGHKKSKRAKRAKEATAARLGSDHERDAQARQRPTAGKGP